MQVITEVEQGSPEWLRLRLGIVTASNMSKLLVDGKGPEGFGADAISYMNGLIGERITEEIADDFVGNRHTERGHLLEPEARRLYESQTELPCQQVSIVLNHGCGYSPDSFVGDNGLNEIKTKLPKLQVEVILNGVVPKDHYAQCMAGLWLAEREWLDFISYWPGMPLFIKRLHRDEAVIAKMADRVKIFYQLLDDRMAKVMGI